MSALNPSKRKLVLDKPKLIMWALGCLLMYFYLRWYLCFPLIISIGKVLDFKLLVPSIKVSKKFDSLVKGRTVIPLSTPDLVNKVTSYFKGSHCDHFDTMLKDISQVT